MNAPAAQLFRRAGELQKCAYCARQLHVSTAKTHLRATRDHVHPRHLGGTKCVWACVACNQMKGGMTLEAWQIFMRDNPSWWTQFQPRIDSRRNAPKKWPGPKKAKAVEPKPVESKAVKRKPDAKPAVARAKTPAPKASRRDLKGIPPWVRRKAAQQIPAVSALAANDVKPVPVPKPGKRRRPRIWIRRSTRLAVLGLLDWGQP